MLGATHFIDNRPDVAEYLCPGQSLKNIPAKLRDNKEVVLLAVQSEPTSLAFASPRLKNDYDVVYAAVENDGWALQFAASELKANKKIALLAVTNRTEAYYLIDPSLQTDADIVLAALADHEYSGFGHIQIPPELLRNRDFLIRAVKYSIVHMQLPSDLRTDPKFILDLFKNNVREYPLECIPHELLLNRDFIRELFSIIAENFDHFSDLSEPVSILPYELWTDKNIFIYTVTLFGPGIIPWFDATLFKDPDVIRHTVIEVINNDWAEYITENSIRSYPTLQQFVAKLPKWTILVGMPIPVAVLDMILVLV